jgi:MoxR-like ATPase
LAVKASIGYPTTEGEMERLQRRATRADRSPSVETVLSPDEVRSLQQVPETVTVTEDVLEYMVAICRATRDDRRVAIGVSPRGTQRLFELARARAVLEGRDYVTPDHVTAIAEPALAHRLVLTSDARVSDVSQTRVVREILDGVQVPTVE